MEPMRDNPLKKLLSQNLTEDNFFTHFKSFEDRQAGVNPVYDPVDDKFYYNAYCLEMKLLKELYSVEYEFIEDALESINEEFATWKLKAFEEKTGGCSTCVAK